MTFLTLPLSSGLVEMHFRLCLFSVSFERWRDPANRLIQALSVADPLRAGSKANPPLNMRNQMILFAAFALSVLPLLFFLKGRQRRREMDEQCAAQADARHQLVNG